MIWYRLVLRRHISLDSDFISGEHSRGSLGRWHQGGTAAVYLGDSPTTVLAECGKYWVCDAAERINNSITSIRGRPPNEWLSKFEEVMKSEAYLAEIDVDDSLSNLDLTQDPPANMHYRTAGFPGLTLEGSRANSFLNIPGQATRSIGTFYSRQRVPFLRVPSARSTGSCGVLFPENYRPNRVRVIKKTEVNLYTLDNRGGRINGKKITKLNDTEFEAELLGSTHKIAPLKL